MSDIAIPSSPERRELNHADRSALKSFEEVLTDNSRPEHRLFGLHFAIDHVIRKRLSQSEAAQFAPVNRRVAQGYQRPLYAHATTDGASARLQIIADQFEYLNAEHQKGVATLVAALANGAPDRVKHLRGAVREFLASIFEAQDWIYIGKAAMDWISRRSPAEPEAAEAGAR